jgi:hypothetical protein
MSLQAQDFLSHLSKMKMRRCKAMNGYEFRTILATICPDYSIDEDSDGQLVIHTNMKDDGNDNYVRMERG